MDPEQYRGQRVLVVGGGDSAVEAALACASEPRTTVTLAYRGEAFNRVKAQNRARLDEASRAGRLAVLLRAEVRSIAANRVDLEVDGAARPIGNDAVIVQAGGVLPTDLLQRAGIAFERKFGTA